MRRSLGVLATTTALLLASLTSPAGATLPDRGHSDSPPAPDRVRLTIKVHGCETCKLGLTQVHENPEAETGHDSWYAKERRVRHGKVVFTVAAEHTRGTSISISAPWATDWVHGVRYVVVRYRGFETGEPVSPRQAARARRAGRCWSGADRDRTIHVRVVRTDSETIGGDPAVGMRAWASPTLSSTDLGGSGRQTVVTTYPVCPAG